MTTSAGASASFPWAAVGYPGAVLLASRLVRRLPAEERARLLRGQSTNVDNLRSRRWYTLVTSAFLTEQPMTAPRAALLAATLGVAELRWGTRRTVGVLTSGHIGGSLAVYAGLRALGPAPGTASAVDVGVSYGLNAVLGALAASTAHRGLRRVATAGLLASQVRPVLGPGRTFTDAGHLVSALLGAGAARVGGGGVGDHRPDASFVPMWIRKRHPHPRPIPRTR